MSDDVVLARLITIAKQLDAKLAHGARVRDYLERLESEGLGASESWRKGQREYWQSVLDEIEGEASTMIASIRDCAIEFASMDDKTE